MFQIIQCVSSMHAYFKLKIAHCRFRVHTHACIVLKYIAWIVVFTSSLNLSATFLVECTRVSIFHWGKSKLENNWTWINFGLPHNYFIQQIHYLNRTLSIPTLPIIYKQLKDEYFLKICYTSNTITTFAN